MEKRLKIIWTDKALSSLRGVYEFYIEKSGKIAQKITNEIIEQTENLHFSNQYQQDDILPQYRRIIVRHYKILYYIR